MIAIYGTYMIRVAATGGPTTPMIAAPQRSDALGKADLERKAEMPKPVRAERRARVDADAQPAYFSDADRQPAGTEIKSPDFEAALHAGARQSVPNPDRTDPIMNAAAGSAAHAILRRISEAAGETPPASGSMEAEAEQASAAPLPERRPYATEDIARHETSSQSGARMTRAAPRAPRISPAVRSYRESVRTHLALHKPSGGLGAGRVAVFFTLSPEGGIASARILRAPPASDLGDVILNAVRRAAPFPQAPEDASREQRNFTISFVFE